MSLLASIPGAELGRILEQLPPAERDGPEAIERTFEVTGIGPVLFGFQRVSHRHGKSRHTFWTAVRARRPS